MVSTSCPRRLSTAFFNSQNLEFPPYDKNSLWGMSFSPGRSPWRNPRDVSMESFSVFLPLFLKWILEWAPELHLLQGAQDRDSEAPEPFHKAYCSRCLKGLQKEDLSGDQQLTPTGSRNKRLRVWDVLEQSWPVRIGSHSSWIFWPTFFAVCVLLGKFLLTYL